MIKKISQFIMLLALMITLPIATTFAVEVEMEARGEADLETMEIVPIMAQSEVEARVQLSDREQRLLNYRTGVQTRLAQLEQRIDAQISGANLIIERLREKGHSTEQLEEIVFEFEMIKDDIASMNLEQEPNVLAREFVYMLSKATELTKDFRITVSNMLTEEEKNQIRSEVRNAVNERIQARNERVEMLRAQHNAEVALKNAERIGVNLEIVQRIQSGEISPEEAKNEIKEKVQEMTPEERRRIAQELAEERNRIVIENQERAREMIESARERIEENRAITRERIETTRERIEQERINTRERIETARERIEQEIREREQQTSGTQIETRVDTEIETDRINSSVEVSTR